MQQNHRLLRALRRMPVDRTPVWIMRQAGRYLPEYRKVREQAGNFLNLCKTPELACEVTLQPLARYDLDAAIIFSDILTIPDAMGLGLQLIEKVGPKFDKPIHTVEDIDNLPHLDPMTDLEYVMDAIRLVKHELADRVPLLGFSGSPWTLATYMVEGASSKDFIKTKKFLYQHPEAFHRLLKILSDNITQYVLAQINMGVNAVMIFDTWGGILTPHEYRAASLQYMKNIVNQVQAVTDTPIILFTKNGNQHLVDIAATGCDAIGLDWTIEIGKARKLVGDKVALQGNLDPSILFAPNQTIQTEVNRVLTSYGNGSGHIFNLGHGITPGVDPDKLACLIDAVKEHSVKFHSVEKNAN